MGNYLNLGNAGFQAIVKGHYVDKTGLLSFINGTLGTMDKLTCVSRPRRFGKSFAAKMLCAYYDKSCQSIELFRDLEIARDISFELHLNKYDVIYLDITLFIAGATTPGNIVSDMQIKVIEEIREAYPEVKEEQTLFETLSSVVETTGNKFIIIIGFTRKQEMPGFCVSWGVFAPGLSQPGKVGKVVKSRGLGF